jgi:hypothetical protein
MPTLIRTATNQTTGPLGGIAPAKPESAYIIEFIMTFNFRSFIGI